MLADIISALGTAVSIVLLLVSFVAQPTRASCSPSWYVARVTPVGFYVCKRTMNGDLPESMRPKGLHVGWIYCTNGTRAVTNIDGETVGCSP